MSLQTSSSFIAVLTINDSSLRGSWQISLQSGNFYNILVSASSALSFTSDLLTLDTSSSYGFSSVVGKPLNGEYIIILYSPYFLCSLHYNVLFSGVPLIAVFQASDTSTTLTVEEINVVDSFGAIHETTSTILSLDGNAFAINFIPPDVPFQWQIVGRDEEGYTFSRISDTAIEVSNIDLSLGNIFFFSRYSVHSHISNYVCPYTHGLNNIRSCHYIIVCMNGTYCDSVGNMYIHIH